MYQVSGSDAFWAFAVIDFAFLALAVISSRLVGPRKPNKIKNTTFECGQDPFGEARSFRLTGISRYFGYAVAFFALDAFAWIILTSALSFQMSPGLVSMISIYTLVIFSGIAYFLVEKDKLVN